MFTQHRLKNTWYNHPGTQVSIEEANRKKTLFNKYQTVYTFPRPMPRRNSSEYPIRNTKQKRQAASEKILSLTFIQKITIRTK